MFKLQVVCIIVLAAVCCAQKHITCSITDDAWNQHSPLPPQRALQGSPGKRGPKGQVGSRGSPGEKGEPGVPDDRQINLLRDQLNSLSQEVEHLKNKTRETLHVIPAGSKILYVDHHFYAYQLTPGRQWWQESRQYYQTWGGELAVHGVKTLKNRRRLIRILPINEYFFWVGASDAVSEGSWIWVNGDHASSSELNWDSGQPGGGRSENYVMLFGNSASSKAGLAHDGSSTTHRGLCEKLI